MTTATQDRTHPGQILEIPGLDGKYVRIEPRYDYANAKTTCPACKHTAGGVPWGGWFSCGTRCGCVALVDTGEAFVKLEQDQ